MKTRTREVLKFLSGFQTAHLLSHIFYQLAGPFPFNFKALQITITRNLNSGAIAVNAVILCSLLYFAYWHKQK